MLSDILNYLKKNKEASASEIAVILKFDRRMTEEALNELISKGRIERNIIRHASCGSCTGRCSLSSCVDNEVFHYIEAKAKKNQLAS